MPTSTVDLKEGAKPKNYFATTHWSVVRTAGRQDTVRSGIALEKLCQTYWFPLYAYVRRRGFSAHDAQDLTQGFFECLLRRQSLANADPEHGRFRSFMLGAMNHFLADDWEKSGTQKRGGNQKLISLDLGTAEKRFDLDPADQSAPAKSFDKEWATALLDEVLNQLEKEYRDQGKTELFNILKVGLAVAREALPYGKLALRLNMSEGAMRVAVHRLRKRYRELLKLEIAKTVISPAEVKEEMLYLFKTMLDG